MYICKYNASIMIKDNLKKILQSKGMTQIQLAKKLGISPETLSRTIGGNPTLKSLNEISQAIDIEVSRLFGQLGVQGYLEFKGSTKKIGSLTDIADFLESIFEEEEYLQYFSERELHEFKDRLEGRILFLKNVDFLRKKGKLLESE